MTLNQIKSFSQTSKYFHTSFFLNPDFMSQLLKSSFCYAIGKDKIPLPNNVNLTITSRCNLNCNMCYYTDELNKDNNMINIEDIKKLQMSFKNKRTIFFITGGEPFIRQDILEIVELIKQNKSHLCGVVTNGTLLTKKKIDRLIELNLDMIVFSLLGTEKEHNEITGNKSSYNLFMKNVRYFSQNNKNTYILLNVPVSKENINFLTKIISLGESLKVSGVRFNHLQYITPEEYSEHIKYLKTNFKSEKSFSNIVNINNPDIDVKFILKTYDFIRKNKCAIDVFFHPYLSKKEIKEWYSPDFVQKRKCFFLWKGTFIGPEKNVYPCQYYNYPYGNLNNDSFENIWNGESAIKFRKLIKKSLLPGCKRCCKL